MEEIVLLGDEALALGALHAGLSAAYGYPGTPSTEILEYLIRRHEAGTGPLAAWCANEKTAYEAALGVSFAGKRTLVTMKHVGLNVAADPFVNSALVEVHGGLVLAVADDPGMHSSQDEQDSRWFARFAGVLCLEPANQQQAYAMVQEAFDLSERFHQPVVVRITTRLAHSRAVVKVAASGRAENAYNKTSNTRAWTLIPGNARVRNDHLQALQKELEAWSDGCAHNWLVNLPLGRAPLGIVTTGLGGNSWEENREEFEALVGGPVPRLHVGAYPVPAEKLRTLAARVDKILVIEEGAPLVETDLRGVLPTELVVEGKLDGRLPRTGELNPDLVRSALGLAPRPRAAASALELPARPPQLCAGCPHGDAYAALNQAVAGLESVAVVSDIGCYALGSLPPLKAIESLVCMGASIGMAKGASDAGCRHAVAVIGDSTFLHSGLTPLVDAVAANTPMTVLILDNSIVAMTGCQDTMLPSARIPLILQGIGVDPDHLVEIDATRIQTAENAARLRAEIEYRGLSVVIARRECLEAVKARRKKTGQGGAE